MGYNYSERMLIQKSALNLLRDELGWEVRFAHYTESLGAHGTFGRGSYREVLLVRYLREALVRLNPWITDEQITQAQKALESRLSTSTLLQINEEKYFLIRDGIPVTVKRPDGKTETKRAAVIDFQDPDNNHFLAIEELEIHGDLYRRRTDIVGFVNGIPLLFMELKKNTVDVQNAYTDNYTDYLDTIPQLFYYNAFLILSNGLEAKAGTLGSKYEFFHEWKRLAESDPGSVELSTMLRGICNRETFLDLLENFLLFDHSGGHTEKILARNHQYLGVNEAVKAYRARRFNDGKLGVFWHTQGSGKSYSMVFLAQKIRRKFGGSPTFLIVTDREDLNRQLSDIFENCGLLGKTKATQFIAANGPDLINKLRGNPSFIFTLIHKFNQSGLAPIRPDHDLIIFSDEAHRSQYGIFAGNMWKLLPTAARIGFTGTPLLAEDQITARTFGGYVSVYDFRRAVEDGATVPLYYENRGEKILDLRNPEITGRLLDAIERADFDAGAQRRLEAEFAKELHLMTAEPRLRAVARDFARHYSDLWTSGKAMFVCLNKVTCVRMYQFVQEYWREEISALRAKLGAATQQGAQELRRKLAWMEETEMAVVVSQEQNEIQTFKQWGLDIKYHREKMERRDLDKEFKDPQNPLRVVFVCAMWLTGFDVKCLSCLYLDKPMKAHTLMQAIARANRVSAGKANGLILDYIGIVKALRRALADYTANVHGSYGADPTVDKEKLIAKLLDTLAKTKEFLLQRGVALQELIDARDFEKLSLIQAAADAVCGRAADKKAFAAYASELGKLVKYADRRDIGSRTRKACEGIAAIYGELQKKRKHVDKTGLTVEVNNIISEYLQIDTPGTEAAPARQFDISRIDFDLLCREFSGIKKKNLAMRDLEDVLQQTLDSMVFSNPKRINYYERYQQIITDYNREQSHAAIEDTFTQLMLLANRMRQEEQRYLREGFTCDEELSLYDILFKEGLSEADTLAVKRVAAGLLRKLKDNIAQLDHWTDKQETRAAVDNLIRDTLWSELPDCYGITALPEYRRKIYEFVYKRYRHSDSS